MKPASFNQVMTVCFAIMAVVVLSHNHLLLKLTEQAVTVKGLLSGAYAPLCFFLFFGFLMVVEGRHNK